MSDKPRLQTNPEPLRVVKDREQAGVQSFAEWASKRGRAARLRVWLALGGKRDEFGG